MSRQLWCAAALAVSACTFDGIDEDAAGRRKPTAPDAAVAVDAPVSSSDQVTFSCYSEGAPDRMCASPDHCCFSNYTAQHNGYCTTETCTWGAESCDGAEDCGSGSCCGLHTESGWTLSCQAACGVTNEELCHPGDACKNGGSCVNVYGVNNDLPRTLYVCR